MSATLPADAAVQPQVVLGSISCASAGNCSAVGSYEDTSGTQQGLLLTEFSGTWSPGIKATLPADAGAYALVALNSVSCASPGNCSAVGDYRDGSGEYQGLVLTQSSGVWGSGMKATPADAGPEPYVFLTSVSCPLAGDCGAVGYYTDGSDHQQGLLLTQSSGVWGPGVKTGLPADAGPDPRVFLESVSCASPGSCSAVGDYLVGEANEFNQHGLLVTETSGAESQGTEATPPGDSATTQAVGLRSVSCVSAGNCSAVGDYRDSSFNGQGLLLVESSGAWGPGVKSTLPADAGEDPRVLLESVSCASPGNCSGVGGYTDASGYYHGLLLMESSGAWGSGVEATLPVDASGSPDAVLNSVSCASPGNCGAVGGYDDSSGHGQGVLLTESAGAWGPGVKATLPADAGTDPRVLLTSVSCPLSEGCSAVGNYADGSGGQQGLLLGGSSVSGGGPGGGAGGGSGGGAGGGSGVGTGGGPGGGTGGGPGGGTGGGPGGGTGGGSGGGTGSGGPGHGSTTGGQHQGTPAIGTPRISGAGVRVPVHCSGASGSSCSVKLTISVTETLKGSRLVALSAAKRKTSRKTVVLGSASVTIVAGKTATVKISLNGVARRLLAQRHRLRAKLALSEASHAVITTTITFRSKQT